MMNVYMISPECKVAHETFYETKSCIFLTTKTYKNGDLLTSRFFRYWIDGNNDDSNELQFIVDYKEHSEDGYHVADDLAEAYCMMTRERSFCTFNEETGEEGEDGYCDFDGDRMTVRIHR